MSVEIKVPRHRRLQGRAGHRDPRQRRPEAGGRRPADHAGERQGHHGHPGAAGRDGPGAEGQGRRPGGPGQHRSCCSRARGRPRPRPRSGSTRRPRPRPRCRRATARRPGVYESIEVKVPDIGDFKDVAIIEVHVAAGDDDQGRRPADHARERQGHDGHALAGRGQGRRAQGQGGRPGLRGRPDPAAPDRRQGSGVAAPRAGTTAPTPKPPSRRRRATTTPRCWCWAPGPAATPPPSAPPTSARRWCWSSAGRRWAASASTSAASRPRRCCTRPR